MLDHGTLIHRYQPTDVRLGRHQRLDARSLPWIHHHDGAPLRTVRHEIPIPILDQQRLLAQGIRVSQLVPGGTDVDALGSCTANAGTAAAAFLHAADLAAIGLTVDPKACEEYAIRLYHEETLDDAIPGEWPPTDAGSSGLGIATALKARGLIDHYVHATTADAIASLLRTGPVLIGTPWFRSWFTPDPDGFVDSGDWAASGLSGGHEVLAIGLDEIAQDSSGRVIPERTVVRLRNSWSPNWGPLGGEFRLRLSTYALLRRHCDAIQLRKTT